MRKLSLLIFIIPLSTKLYGQLNLQQKISVSARQVTLETFLNQLETDFHVVQSYGMDNVNGQCIISIEAHNTRLMDILLKAADQCNLQFTVIGETIVFKAKSSLLNIERDIKGEEAIPNNPGLLFNTIPSRPRPLQDLLVKVDSIKIPAVIFAPSNAQQDVSRRVRVRHYASIFINYGYDINYYNYRDRPLDFQYFETKHTPAVGLGLEYNLTAHWHAALMYAWSQKEFALHHNFQVLDEEDPFPIMNQTNVDMKYHDFSFSLSYDLNLTPRHSLSVSMRYMISNLNSKNETTTYLNATPKASSYFVDASRRKLAELPLASPITTTLANRGSFQLNQHLVFLPLHPITKR